MTYQQALKAVPSRGPTPAMLSDVLLGALRAVERVSWTRRRGGVVDVKLHLPWWAWLSLGVIHYFTISEAEAILRRFGAAGVRYRVSA